MLMIQPIKELSYDPFIEKFVELDFSYVGNRKGNFVSLISFMMDNMYACCHFSDNDVANAWTFIH